MSSSEALKWSGMAAVFVAGGAAGTVMAAPAWFDNAPAPARGFRPGTPDYFQHQYYVGNPADTWESSQPDGKAYPFWAQMGGICKPVAITDTLGYWESSGYAGIIRPNSLAGGGAWQAASKGSMQDVVDTVFTTGVQAYIDAKQAADAAGPKVWPNKLQFDQFSVDAKGIVTTATGKKLQEPDGKGGFTPISIFSVYERTLLNGFGAMFRLEKEKGPAAPTYDSALWWGDNSYHYVSGVGVDAKNGLIFFADPDSNKGNRSANAGYKPQSALSADAGNAGWVFDETDPSKGATIDKTLTWIRADTGAVIANVLAEPNAGQLYVDGTGAIKTAVINGTGAVKVVAKKGTDANIDARKFTGADAAPPLPTFNGKADPTSYADYYGTFKFDLTSPSTATKIIQSEDNKGGGSIAATGRYHDVLLKRLEVIGPAGADPIKKVNGVNGIETDIRLVSNLTDPVDMIQICGIGNIAEDDATFNGKHYLSLFGDDWTGAWIDGVNAIDGFGNLIPEGFWQFSLTSPGSTGLSGLDALTVTTVTSSDLDQYDVLYHVKPGTDPDGYSFGGYWAIQSFGEGELIDIPQVAAQAIVPEPGISLLTGMLGLFGLARRRRRRSDE